MLHKGNYLVCGMPRSGKGMLMRGLAERYKQIGVPVLYWTSKEAELLGVRDMVHYVSMDANAFFEFADRVRNDRPCIIMIDEAMDFQQSNPNELRQMLNQWPAYGVETFVIVQRARMVPPNVRNACNNCISFKQRPDDAQILADSYGDEFLQTATDAMGQGCFICREGIYAAPEFGKSWEVHGGVFRRV